MQWFDFFTFAAGFAAGVFALGVYLGMFIFGGNENGND